MYGSPQAKTQEQICAKTVSDTTTWKMRAEINKLNWRFSYFNAYIHAAYTCKHNGLTMDWIELYRVPQKPCNSLLNVWINNDSKREYGKKCRSFEPDSVHLFGYSLPIHRDFFPPQSKHTGVSLTRIKSVFVNNDEVVRRHDVHDFSDESTN